MAAALVGLAGRQQGKALLLDDEDFGGFWQALYPLLGFLRWNILPRQRRCYHLQYLGRWLAFDHKRQGVLAALGVKAHVSVKRDPCAKQVRLEALPGAHDRQVGVADQADVGAKLPLAAVGHIRSLQAEGKRQPGQRGGAGFIALAFHPQKAFYMQRVDDNR